jgi:hypothetical protein
VGLLVGEEDVDRFFKPAVEQMFVSVKRDLAFAGLELGPRRQMKRWIA